MKQRSKVILGIIAGFVVVFLIIWFSPVGRFILLGGLSTKEQPFNSAQWKAVSHEEPDKMRVRLLMLDDLLENQLKPTMDSTNVKELLGEPDHKYGFSYPLGQLAPGIDPIFLILTFDTDGKLDKRDVQSEGKFRKTDSNSRSLEINL